MRIACLNVSEDNHPLRSIKRLEIHREWSSLHPLWYGGGIPAKIRPAEYCDDGGISGDGVRGKADGDVSKWNEDGGKSGDGEDVRDGGDDEGGGVRIGSMLRCENEEVGGVEGGGGVYMCCWVR